MTTESTGHEEPGRPQRAFEIYVSLGEGRTYAQVADHMGVALPTVKRWAKQGKWRTKVQERELELAKKVASHYAASRLARIDRNLKLIHAGLLRIGKGITGGNVKLQLADLEKLIRLEMDLVEDPKTSGATTHPGNVVIYIPHNGRGPVPPGAIGELPPPRDEEEDEPT